jgi:hypothetical protein
MNLFDQALADLSTAVSTPSITLLVSDHEIVYQGQVMTCGDCGQPAPPSALEDGSFQYLGGEEDGPSFLLLYCSRCPGEAEEAK